MEKLQTIADANSSNPAASALGILMLELERSVNAVASPRESISADPSNFAHCEPFAVTHEANSEKDADVFRRATVALRTAYEAGNIRRNQAIADNRRLWLTITDLMQDPLNSLPHDLRTAIVSVGQTVQHEMDSQSPNFEFLIAVNEHIATDLSEQR